MNVNHQDLSKVLAWLLLKPEKLAVMLYNKKPSEGRLESKPDCAIFWVKITASVFLSLFLLSVREPVLFVFEVRYAEDDSFWNLLWCNNSVTISVHICTYLTY